MNTSVLHEIAAAFEATCSNRELARMGASGWFAWQKGLPTSEAGRLKAWLDHLNGSERCIVGTYFFDDDSRCKRGVIDIDGHRPEQTPLENLAKLVDAIEAVGNLWYMVARSKGGNGFHVEFLSNERIPGPHLRTFLCALVKRAGLPDDTEVFPKSSWRTTPYAGGQVARPGSAAWNKSTGGSTYIDFTSLEPIPLEEWPVELRRAAGNFDREHLEEACRRMGVRLPSPDRPSEEEDLDGLDKLPRSYGIQEVESFLRERAIPVKEAKTVAHGRWTRKWRLVECPFSSAHSPADRPQQDTRGGAAVLFDERRGKIGFKCFHEHCSSRTWQDFRKKYDPDGKHHFTPPMQTPASVEVDHRLTRDERDALISKLHEIFPGPANQARRTHLERVLTCTEAHGPQACPKDHPAGSICWACEANNIDPYCAHMHAEEMRRFIEQNWVEGAAVLEFSVEDCEDRSDALREVIAMRRLVRAKFPRGLFYGWFIGLLRGIFVAPPRKLGYLEKIRDFLENLGIEVVVRCATPEEAGRAVADVMEEPGRIFHELVRHENLRAISAFPYLLRSSIKRSDHGRKNDGDVLPWLNYAAKRRRLVEESRKKRGVDMEHCAHVEVVNGESHICGLPLTTHVTDSRDGQLLYISRPDEPAWKTRQVAFAVVAAKRRLEQKNRLEAHANDAARPLVMQT